MPRGLFVTGTDTGVGKTVVSAALLYRFRALSGLQYWKPIQTGAALDDDTATVGRLAGETGVRILEPGVRFPDPVSPHLAAARAGQRIDLAPLMAPFREASADARWIVEGAGGAAVPINDSALMCDLMSALSLPVLVVARSSLGTINHTVLTLDYLRARSLTIAGVVMAGDANPSNRAAIETYGRAVVVGELPVLEPLTPAALGAWAARALDPRGELEVWLS